VLSRGSLNISSEIATKEPFPRRKPRFHLALDPPFREREVKTTKVCLSVGGAYLILTAKLGGLCQFSKRLLAASFSSLIQPALLFGDKKFKASRGAGNKL